MTWSEIIENLVPEGFEALVAATVVAVLTAAVWGFVRIGRRIERAETALELHESRNSLKEHEATVLKLRRDLEAKSNEAARLDLRVKRYGGQLERIRNGVEGGLAAPLEEPPEWRRRPSQIPIIAVGNLKGGVGKTTLTANLGAYFGDTESEPLAGRRPTLFIDFDFQGSLSATLIAAGRSVEAGSLPLNDNRALRLFRREISVDDRLSNAREIVHQRLAGSRFYDANADLAPAEERMFFEWIFAEDAAQDDPRLLLGSFLHSDAVQRSFGAVVIDLPPRNTLFAFNALFAANNVVIPTREDQISLQAAQTFVEFLEQNREEFWPRLTIAGLAGINTTHAFAKSDEVDALLQTSARDLSLTWGGVQSDVPYLGKVPWMAQIAEAAGANFAIFDKQERVKAGSPHALFKMIGDAVSENLRL